MELGVIRKIVIGKDPKNAMAYYVGMNAGGSSSKVSAIVFDERYFHASGNNRFLIYVKNSEGNSIWKVIDSMPTILEMDLNF